MFSNWKSEQRRAFALLIVILILLLGAAFFLFYSFSRPNAGYVARISQDGRLLHEIDLEKVTETYTLRIEGDDGAYNVIEVRPGSIGMIEASCPDHLCIHMGFIQNDALPVTCLPNRVVIQIFCQ